MNIKLRPEDEEYIRAMVAAGRFDTPEDVVANAISVLKGQEFPPEHVDYLRDALRRGIEELDRGEGGLWNSDGVRRKLRERFGG